MDSQTSCLSHVCCLLYACNIFCPTDDYRSHTSCLTEVERYEKRDPAKRKATKQTPQEAWMELLADSVAGAPTHLRQHLSEISARDNVPRKEKQFRNFVANSMRISKSTVDQIWNYLKELKDKQQAAKEAQKLAEESQKKEKEESSKSEKVATDKPKAAEPSESNKPEKESPPDAHLPSADELKKAMKKILKGEKDKAMPIKSLRKAVCAKYGLEKKGKKQLKKLLKDHLSGKKFVVDGKLVRLKVD